MLFSGRTTADLVLLSIVVAICSAVATAEVMNISKPPAAAGSLLQQVRRRRRHSNNNK
jgi:hypothetical protein